MEHSGFKPRPGSLCCVLEQHTTLTVPLSTHEYKWVAANCGGNLTECCGGLASHPGVEAILLANLYDRNYKSVGLAVIDFTFYHM